jgi:deoxyribonuclease V
VLGKLETLPAAVIIDGYVWLDAAGRPGLGARLHEALGGRVPVVGVAKTAFRGDDGSVPVLRGLSARPLRVTAAGMPAAMAAAKIAAMHGPHRIPIMLRLADTAARRGAGAS